MSKIKKLRSTFEDLEIDGIIIASPTNRRYMTGFTGTAGVVIISREEAVFVTDFRYVEQAACQAKGYNIVQYKEDLIAEIAKQVVSLGITKLGFEEEHLSYKEFRKYTEAINVSFVPTSGVVEKLREIKTEEEISAIKSAAAIGDIAFTHILNFIKPGITEKKVANELEFVMRRAGATSSAYDIIVASGYRSALPHGIASDKVIEKGDMVTLDFGAYYNGYRSDLTRTVAVGKPNGKLKEIYQVVLQALNKGVTGIRAGLTTNEVDALPRSYIQEKGYGDYFGHGAGHGIGLDIHENPFFSTRGKPQKIEAGMVVTIEPGIYIPDLGGVRIEDDLLVTESGNEVLTQSIRELTII
ncbi:Xaa-Pro peptidase family protein [uncultured Metabacillus sp.]|uniref:M24 family metallopeptidase n=1 Tax=uncultured Metabacillus sp. TaxID=2860135 RepID=UPI0026273612|nr:Xaa-Pro peptidase family protein [uncultured Metabacillus sp.]